MRSTLCDLIAKSNFSINGVVNSQPLQNYFTMKGWRMPSSCSTVKKIIVDYSKEKITEIADSIKGVKVSLMLDEWTNCTNKRFLSVVATTNEKAFNLGLSEIVGSGTSANLLNLLKEKMTTFSIEEKNVIGCTSDGASVMKKLLADFGKISQTCYAHAIHLCVMDLLIKKESRDGLSVIKNDLQESDEDDSETQDNEFTENFKERFKTALFKLSKIVNSFSHSALLIDMLSEYQKLDKVELLLPIKCIKTRWNSILLSVTRMIKIYL